jgi:hypothetical protein
MAKELLKKELGVELWRISTPGIPVEGYTVEDRPEAWTFGDQRSAAEKFAERVAIAKGPA